MCSYFVLYVLYMRGAAAAQRLPWQPLLEDYRLGKSEMGIRLFTDAQCGDERLVPLRLPTTKVA